MCLLAPAASADTPACRYVPVATLALRGTGDVWQPTVDGSINGKPAVMLFDTGAHASHLLKDSAGKLGVSLQQSSSHSSGIGGTSANYSVQINDFSVGDVHSGRVRMTAIGSMGKTPSFDAILGADFALQMDLEISLAERKVKFYRASGCDDTFLAYWDQSAMEIPFGGTETGHGNPRFIVEVNGVKLEAMIDTGATETTMTRGAAERAGLRVGDPGVRGYGSATGVGAQRMATWKADAEFTIGSETIKNASLVITDNPPQGVTVGMPDMLIGADFLRKHRVLIAMSQRRLYVSYLGGEVFRRPASK
jgi:predicted aspartyl protease